MLINKKSTYALRAVFELAFNYGRGPVKNAAIAGRQNIPIRFLEVILNQLKQGGFINSKRGSKGGYELARAPDCITIGDVMGFIQGPVDPEEDTADRPERSLPLRGEYAFREMWRKIGGAISAVYEGTTFQELVHKEHEHQARYVPDYTI